MSRPLGIGVFLIICLIMFMVSRSSETEEKKSIAPTIGMNNEITVEDMVKSRGESKTALITAENDAETSSNIVSEEDIKNAILSNTNTDSNNNKPSSNSATNSHNVYGTYDMWENKEPSNSKIGYSNIKPLPKKKTSSKTMTMEYREKEMNSYEQAYQPEKTTTVIASINAESISQGYVSNGRKWNFIFNESFILNGDKISENNSYAEGIMKIEGGRAFCKIMSVKANGKIYPVLGKIVGADGEDGYFLPESREEYDQSIEGALKDEANNQVSRIPIVGGVLSRTTNRRTSKKRPLADDIQVKIIIYKN